jgi:hypothetical protein
LRHLLHFSTKKKSPQAEKKSFLPGLTSLQALMYHKQKAVMGGFLA